MKYEHWLSDSGITHVDVGSWTKGVSGELHVARVALSGVYESDDAPSSSRVLRMAIAAALSHQLVAPIGLVLNVTELEYWGGDSLLSWLDLVAAGREAPAVDIFRTAFCCGPQNVAHVKSLIEDSGDEDYQRVFMSEDDALLFALGGKHAMRFHVGLYRLRGTW